jgi:peptidoglycan/xylan/chitin deacetylase (PgdA/CDA1 family)
MLNNRIFNILYIVLILVWIWADQRFQIGAPAYGWLLLTYISVLFCGTYFIRLGFFLKSICSGPPTEKCIAISFDDGPSGEKTDRILDLLKENRVQAAFFCIGKNLAGRESQLDRMIQEGHMIGNHSFSHDPFFDLFSVRRMLGELKQMSESCKAITGLSPRFFRPPYGVTNPNLKKAISRGGFISVGWSIRSYDTISRNESRLLKKILKALKPGAILLLHDTQEITVQILPRLLKGIQDKGYGVKRLDKLINLNPYD